MSVKVVKSSKNSKISKPRGHGSAPGERRGGRQKGTQNKRNAAAAAAMVAVGKTLAEVVPDAFAGDSHALLIAVYKNSTLPLGVRIDAAKAAIRYERPALATVAHTGRDGGPINLSLRVVFGK